MAALAPVLAALLAAIYLAPGASAHGFLSNPCGRNCQSYNPVEKNYEITGVRGGGPSVVNMGYKLKWPQGRHGMCGDAWNASPRWMTPRRITAKYVAGSVANFGVVIWNNHAGRMGFRLCKPYAKSEKDCTGLLERADKKGWNWFYLPLPKNDPELKTMWKVYGPTLVPENGPGFTWNRMTRRKDGMNQFEGSVVINTRWRIPKNFCKGHCILQWYYLTGNSCRPPCSKEDPDYPNCAKTCKFPNCFCNQEGAAYPEEFWNCADVMVVNKKKGGKRGRRLLKKKKEKKVEDDGSKENWSEGMVAFADQFSQEAPEAGKK